MNTIKRGVFKIAEQIDNHGFYGEIELDCTLTSDVWKLKLDLDDLYERWRPGILFAGMYFIEHSTETIGLNIKVIKIRSNEVDTTNTVIAYLTLSALLFATGAVLTRNVFFDKAVKSFVFPK